MPVPIDVILAKAKASGFDAELTVAAILRNNGWTANQSVYYIDKDEDKGRELDILAYNSAMKINDDPHITCFVFLCIEVKRTADPFIFFSDKSRAHEGGGGFSILKWMNRVSTEILPYKSLESLRPFANVARIARSYMSFKGGGESHIKNGVLSAFKAAVHWSEKADETYSEKSHDIAFYVPIVVVDGPMHECYFPDGDSELTANEVDSIVYMQNYQSGSYGSISCRVNVINIEAFEAVLVGYKKWADHLLATMVANLKK